MLEHELYIDCTNRQRGETRNMGCQFDDGLPEWNLFDYGCSPSPVVEATRFTKTLPYFWDAKGCHTPRMYLRVSLRDLPDPTDDSPHTNYRLFIHRY